MKVTKTSINGVLIIKLNPISDLRGSFVEVYQKNDFSKLGINSDFNQDIITNCLHKNTVRGLHFQKIPFEQQKLVRCQRGAIRDISVDLRKSSNTYMKVFSIDLEDTDWTWIYLPAGVAHGFASLDDNIQVTYKVSGDYSAQHATGIKWDDPELNIDWQIEKSNIILSEKDRSLPNFDENNIYFS
tara:strand:+ start:1980 stop:2534 length:555 start_codon:yes stop_codon:yes gene_type:complete